MSGRPGIKRAIGRTVSFGESKAGDGYKSKNHEANVEGRPIHKLRKLLCPDGDRSNGTDCLKCEAKCKFGKEYIARINKTAE